MTSTDIHLPQSFCRFLNTETSFKNSANTLGHSSSAHGNNSVPAYVPRSIQVDDNRNFKATERKQRRFVVPPAAPSPPKLDLRLQPVTSWISDATRLYKTFPINKFSSKSSTMMLPLPLITSVPAETAEQWLFTDDEIEHSPSSLQGLSGQEERERRAKGVAFIAQVGLSLKLPQATITTGAMFFHRMFMRIGMVEKQGGLHHYVSEDIHRPRRFHSCPEHH